MVHAAMQHTHPQSYYYIHILYFQMTARLNLATVTTPLDARSGATKNKHFVNSSFVQYSRETSKIEDVHKQVHKISN